MFAICLSLCAWSCVCCDCSTLLVLCASRAIKGNRAKFAHIDDRELSIREGFVNEMEVYGVFVTVLPF